MSRSRKKAIYKGRGHRKEDYWRAYRRVTKPVIKKFFNYKGMLYDWFYEDMLYSEYVDELIDSGYSEDDAHKIANIKSSYDYYIEPEIKSPKEVIDDYDYSDFRVDYEYMKRKGYFYEHISDGYSEEWYKERQEQAKVMRRK